MTAPRVPKLAVEDLDADQRALYDAIARGPRSAGPRLFALTDPAGCLEGPFNAMLLSPALGGALQALGSAVRYRSALTDRAREIAILVVAWAWDSAFETYAHEAVARSVGLSATELAELAELAAVREGRWDEFDEPSERLVAATTTALVARGDLTDQEFTAARDGLGLPIVFELLTLVGYYATLALQLRVFRVGAPD
jgi:4-carboxymuconolactone decarboxylase